MIEQYQILKAIQSMAHSRFPQIPILEDLTTADFPRPSFYLDPEPLTLEDAGRRLIRVRWAIGLIYFPPVDEESQDAAMEQLLTGSQAMLALFAQGYLTVGNRALHLTASAGKPDRDAAAVILQLDYLDQRPETEQAAAWMEQIHLTAEPKTEG